MSSKEGISIKELAEATTKALFGEGSGGSGAAIEKKIQDLEKDFEKIADIRKELLSLAKTHIALLEKEEANANKITKSFKDREISQKVALTVLKKANKNQEQKRVEKVIQLLEEEYPKSKCSLEFRTPFQLLVATILSAQCTDERVNKVVKPLFEKYPSPKEFAKLSTEEIGKEIYSTGFYNNKAKSIKGMVHALLDEHGGKVPNTLKELVVLPGVGRKTANVVLGNVFNVPGIVVDTHVTRICNLLGVVKSKNAVVIERELEKLIVNKKYWTLFTHLIIAHGRTVCIARRPQCEQCILNNYCNFYKGK